MFKMVLIFPNKFRNSYVVLQISLKRQIHRILEREQLRQVLVFGG